MPKRKRRIKKAKIEFISLCPRGANGFPVIYKSDENKIEFETLIKDDRFAEHGELTAVVYAPEVRDSQGDIASADVCKQMCHDFAKRGGAIDIEHDNVGLSREDAFVAENFLIQKGDERFAGMKDYNGNPVDVTGGWAVVLKIENEDLRKAYREGAWNGVSMGGRAEVVNETVAEKFTSFLTAREPENQPPQEETFMKDEDLKKLTTAIVGGLTEVLTKAGVIKIEEPKAAEPVKKSDELEFEGDPLSKEDVAKHLEKLRRRDMLNKIDFNDVDSLEALLKSDDVTSAKDLEIARLEKQLARARKGSSQVAGTAPAEPQTEMAKCLSLGSVIAGVANGTAAKA